MNADVFCRLFKDFDLVVRCKGKKSRSAATEEDLVSNNSITKSQLKTMLKNAIKDHSRAQKLFKTGKILKEELYDYEWRVFELREELDRLDNGEVY